MRQLYLRIWATVLGALLVFGLIGASARWLFDDGPEGRRVWDGLARVVERELPGPDASPEELEASLRELSAQMDVDLTLRAPDGRVLAVVGPEIEPRGGGGPPWADRERDDRHRGERWGGGRRWWGGGGGPRRGALSVRLPDGRRLFARPERLRLPGWLPSLLGLAVATGIAAYPAVRGLTRSLERLRAQVNALGAGDLSARVDVHGAEEVASLAESFNRAAERIERLVAAQRGTLAAASHELRSPLARMRMAIELCEGESGERLRARVAPEIAELDALIGELLVASRLDALEAGQVLDRREDVDLLALAAEESAHTGAELSGAPSSVAGDASLLRRLVRNLLENARRHGGAGADVHISVTPRADRGARLVVEDRGPGVPEAERERIFEPFYRAAGARESEGGVGLGLALVRQIARRHGGDARCTGRDGGGSRFEVELPGLA